MLAKLGAIVSGLVAGGFFFFQYFRLLNENFWELTVVLKPKTLERRDVETARVGLIRYPMDQTGKLWPPQVRPIKDRPHLPLRPIAIAAISQPAGIAAYPGITAMRAR